MGRAPGCPGRPGGDLVDLRRRPRALRCDIGRRRRRRRRLGAAAGGHRYGLRLVRRRPHDLADARSGPVPDALRHQPDHHQELHRRRAGVGRQPRHQQPDPGRRHRRPVVRLRRVDHQSAGPGREPRAADRRSPGGGQQHPRHGDGDAGRGRGQLCLSAAARRADRPDRRGRNQYLAPGRTVHGLQPVPRSGRPGAGDAGPVPGALRQRFRPRRRRDLRAHPRYLRHCRRRAQQHAADLFRSRRHALQRLPAGLLRHRPPPGGAHLVLPNRRPGDGPVAFPMGVAAALRRRRARQCLGAYGGRRPGIERQHRQWLRQRRQHPFLAVHPAGRRHVDREPLQRAERHHAGPDAGARPAGRSRHRLHAGGVGAAHLALASLRRRAAAERCRDHAHRPVRIGVAGFVRHPIGQHARTPSSAPTRPVRAAWRPRCRRPTTRRPMASRH